MKFSPIGAALQTLGGGSGTLLSAVGSLLQARALNRARGQQPIKSMKRGGPVKRTGLYKLHKGERVIPPGKAAHVAKSILGGKKKSRPWRSKRGQAKITKTMDEWKAGTLHSGSKKGPKVTSRSQAIAIALSQARKAAK